MTSARTLKLTYGEYVAREERAEVKHEFIDGEVFAMAGGTPEHAAIIARVTVLLGSQLLGKRCNLFVTDLRAHVRADEKGPDVATYPDIAVVCGNVERDSEDPNAIVNPVLLIEVLSNSTEAYDRNGKFEHYKRFASMREYVLVSQHEPRVERFVRGDDGNWTADPPARPGGQVVLAAVGATIDVTAIYDGLLDAEGRVRVT